MIKNRIKEIKVTERHDVLIIENFEAPTNTILEGSRIFCGCCGKSIGEVIKELTFPFLPNEFRDNLRNKSFRESLFGLKHLDCGHVMFPMSKSFNFMSVDVYFKMIDIQKERKAEENGK